MGDESWTAPERGLSERARRDVWLARLGAIVAYAAGSAWSGWTGGAMTPGELAGLTVLAGVLVPYLLLVGWIAGGSWYD